MPSEPNTARSPPLLDFSAFYQDDPAKKQQLVDQVRDCCLHNGFFQIINHPVPLELQQQVMECNKEFFSLPLEEKKKVSKDLNTWNRGYELLRSQILEEGTTPELKEGFYIGSDLPPSHPYFVQRKLNSGPNIWPASLPSMPLAAFKSATLAYHAAVVALAEDMLAVLALSLDLPEHHFGAFAQGAVATMRLLHYPSQAPDADEKLTRGIGAHTDFGALTLLLQDEVDGLQVWDQEVGEWFDVLPIPNALVVNLGNLLQRWTNNRYTSNLHRVINRSGRERYSIPVFFSGNPDYVIECLPGCKEEGEEAKYAPITVQEAVGGSYRESYGRAARFKEEAAKKQKEKEMVGEMGKGVPAVAVA